MTFTSEVDDRPGTPNQAKSSTASGMIDFYHPTLKWGVWMIIPKPTRKPAKRAVQDPDPLA
eukprot:7219083-Karenia_brevis.AAC.1